MYNKHSTSLNLLPNKSFLTTKMAAEQHLGFLCLCSFFLFTMSTCPDEDLYVIRSATDKSLVLDSSDPSGQVKFQNFTGYNPQLWKFERGYKVGLFYIVNNATGDPLDLETNESNVKLVTARRRNLKRQQWYLTLKGRIVNAESGENIVLWVDTEAPEESRIRIRNGGTRVQEFVWEKFYLTGLLLRTERAASIM